MAQIENLWGEIMAKGGSLSAKSILNQQAKYLSDMTRNFLVGEVRIIKATPTNPDFIFSSNHSVLKYELLIKAPTLGYQFVLLSVQHDLKGYPIILIDELNNQKFELSDENSFKDCLSHILGSDSTKRALQTLLSQSV